jgi:uncharacterized protein YndB with AHSA1/START domain
MTDNSALATVIDGHTIVFERTVPHPPERVWRAISDEGELTAWMRYPVKFKPEVGARVDFFSGEILGRVFIADPPRTLAFSFEDPNVPENKRLIDAEWTVRWDLEPLGDGCKITFRHRNLGGAHLWGLGEGWHGFLEQLLAYLDDGLEELFTQRPAAGTDDDTTMLTEYRAHVASQLRAWADDNARTARAAATAGRTEEALAAITSLRICTRQLYEIARQDGPRPDYALEPPATVRPS